MVRRVAAWDEERVELIGSDLVDAGLRLVVTVPFFPFSSLPDSRPTIVTWCPVCLNVS